MPKPSGEGPGEPLIVEIREGEPYLNGQPMTQWALDIDAVMRKHNLSAAPGIVLLAWRLGLTSAMACIESESEDELRLAHSILQLAHETSLEAILAAAKDLAQTKH